MGPKSGVYKKIFTQINSWRGLGNEVKLFVVTKDKDVYSALIEAKKNNIEIFKYGRKIKYKYFDDRLLIFSEAANKIISWKPDIVYTRQDLYYPQINNLYDKCRVVIEVNTIDDNEMWIENKLKWLYNVLTRNLLFKKAAGLVFVSGEIASLPSYVKFKKPSIVIGNSIDLSKYKVAPEKKFSNDIRLVFMGNNNCPWHGVDKIKLLANKKQEWKFDLIGEFSNESKLSNIYYHGKLLTETYESIVSRADVGMGSMAMHRIGLNEGSPLKTREYLAYGLPVIIGYRDTDFLNGAEFILELPNKEDNIEKNINLIEEFVMKWEGKRVPRAEISHLDVRYKEYKRIEFFKLLL